jgi:hypothetical protein
VKEFLLYSPLPTTQYSSDKIPPLSGLACVGGISLEISKLAEPYCPTTHHPQYGSDKIIYLLTTPVETLQTARLYIADNGFGLI